MTEVRVAFQGELGAYGDEAIVARWQNRAKAIPSRTFEDVVSGVALGRADFGILPVWNSIVGEIEPGCAAVRLGRDKPHRLSIVGDAHVVVRHHLLALPESDPEEIASVSSHPVALAQCGRFLGDNPRLVPISAYDTAGAARELAAKRTRTSAAIAGRRAAALYGLAVLQADIQDVPDNFTQFLVLAAHAERRNAPRRHLSGESVRW